MWHPDVNRSGPAVALLHSWFIFVAVVDKLITGYWWLRSWQKRVKSHLLQGVIGPHDRYLRDSVPRKQQFEFSQRMAVRNEPNSKPILGRVRPAVSRHGGAK